MLHMDFTFFNVESIRGFTSTFVAILSATPYPFGLPSRSKRPPIDILTFIFNTLRNQDKKAAFVRVDEYGALAIYFEFIKTCHNINNIVQTIGGDASSINGKSESSNNTLDNITRSLLLNSSHKKELWCFPYQYSIWISRQTDNILCGDVPYFLWHVTIPPYKPIKIWGVGVYIINERATIKNLDDRSHRGYFVGYAATTVFIL